MQSLERMKQHLKPGRVYRREDLAKFSNAVDRHLRQLIDAGTLKKVKTGVYYCPKKSIFGEVPADSNLLVAAFLKDDDFLLTSLNVYNSLGVGTTQLYNEQIVYNRKRDGHINLGGQKYFFLKNRKFPKKITEEFLLVDLMNNIDMLAEDTDALKNSVALRARAVGMEKMWWTAKEYGKVATKHFFECILNIEDLSNVR